MTREESIGILQTGHSARGDGFEGRRGGALGRRFADGDERIPGVEIARQADQGAYGRGTAVNPANRFERLHLEGEEAPERVDTVLLRDSSRSVITRNDSPDVPFDATLNPYRGCEHGCAYCYARVYHEFLGFSAGLDFETRILVKEEAPSLLEAELQSPSWRPQTIAMSGATDPYQPAERRLALSRSCLEVLARARNPVSIITKNALVRRDADLLVSLARQNAAAVAFSIITLDAALARRLEPRTSQPRERLRAMAELRAAGVPCGVLVAPVIPGLTDHEIPRVVAAAAAAGASFAAWGLVRLPGPVADIFDDWLRRVVPRRRRRVLERIRDARGGDLDEPRFAHRMHGDGVLARHLDALFEAACRRHDVRRGRPELSAAAFRRPGGEQLSLEF